MQIGLLGGTFNPPHNGHIALARECLTHFDLDKIIFMPTATSPHKNVECSVSGEVRLEMVRIAIEGEPKFEVSRYEIDKGGISYSVETIKYLKKEYGSGTEIFFLTGRDSCGELSTWKEIDRILDLVVFVIATRPGWKKDEGEYDGRVRHFVMPEVDISSSMIRERLSNSKPIDAFVAPAVAEFIKARGLYKEA